MSIMKTLAGRFGKRGAPTTSAAPTPSPIRIEAPLHPDHVDFAGVLRLLGAEWRVIVLALAVFVGAALAYGALTPKTWRTSARVLLDPRDKQLVGADVARQSQGVELGWVETRLELVKSYDTLAAVVKAENLVDDEEILGPAARAKSSGDPVADAVRGLAEMVLVERPKENSLIDVTVSSRSPEKAAKLANAVARAFVDGLVSAKVEQVDHANSLLARQVDEMRSKMLEAEARVETYKRDHGIAMTRGNLVEEETLRQSNENLIAARARTQEARERSERLTQVLKSGDPTVLSQSDAIGSAVISRLKIEAATATRRKVELEQSLGPRHPRVLAAAAEVERARVQVGEEVKSLAATADLDYQIARANEDNARKAVERAQAHLSDASQATVGLQELENDANAQRDLYKSFVSRMQETTLQRNTQVSDARIVSPAQIPLTPFAPRTRLALALALVAGLGFGVSVALYRGRALLHAAAAHGAAAAAPTEPATAPVVSEAVAAAPATASAIAPPPVALAAAPPSETVVEPTPAPADEAAPVPEERAAVEIGAVETDETDDADEASIADADAGVDDETDGLPQTSDGSRRVDFPVGLDHIARLGGGRGPGGGVAALVETARGRPDADGLARFERLVDALAADGGHGVRVIFSNSVPTLLSAALAHGLARAVAGAALVELAHEGAPFDPIFEAAEPLAVAAVAGGEAWERAEDRGLELLRPLDPVAEGEIEPPQGLRPLLTALRAEKPSVVVHLGRRPTAALLLDCAELADHVVAVIDEADLAGRRVADELAVLEGLVPHFDGVIVLTRDDEATAPVRPAARRLAARRAIGAGS
ncbi:MAG: GumC family protein [Hyphomicrobiales bacterium]|nr:GumC family protein [Hyphomicrobiales bacterium]